MSKMVPASRPQQKREETEAILRASGIEMGKRVVLLGVRGYYRDSMGKVGRNDQGMYDDALFVLSPTVHRSFNFNTDPQKAGAKHAMLKPGKYRFYRGKHKGQYDALRPFPEGVRLPCTRDGVDSMCSHTNIHKGGTANTYSEGCQTVPPTQWTEAQQLVYAEMKKYGQTTVEYLLIEN